MDVNYRLCIVESSVVEGLVVEEVCLVKSWFIWVVSS